MATMDHLLTKTHRWACVLRHITFSTATPFSTHHCTSLCSALPISLCSTLLTRRCSDLLCSTPPSTAYIHIHRRVTFRKRRFSLWTTQSHSRFNSGRILPAHFTLPFRSSAPSDGRTYHQTTFIDPSTIIYIYTTRHRPPPPLPWLHITSVLWTSLPPRRNARALYTLCDHVTSGRTKVRATTTCRPPPVFLPAVLFFTSSHQSSMVEQQ